MCFDRLIVCRLSVCIAAKRRNSNAICIIISRPTFVAYLSAQCLECYSLNSVQSSVTSCWWQVTPSLTVAATALQTLQFTVTSINENQLIFHHNLSFRRHLCRLIISENCKSKVAALIILQNTRITVRLLQPNMNCQQHQLLDDVNLGA